MTSLIWYNIVMVIYIVNNSGYIKKKSDIFLYIVSMMFLLWNKKTILRICSIECVVEKYTFLIVLVWRQQISEYTKIFLVRQSYFILKK